MNEKNYKEIEEAEFGVESIYFDQKERLKDSQALMEARLGRLENLSKDQVVKARLIQLKLKMEEFLRHKEYEGTDFFTNFLTSYIDITYHKRSDFASDMSITPVSLSQVLNGHREPKEEFMLKLMVHSEITFRNVARFSKKIWYEIYYREKIEQKIASLETFRPKIEKMVRIKSLVQS